jgi:hypothetical protein
MTLHGWRPTDLEVTHLAPLRVSCAFVRNAHQYHTACTVGFAMSANEINQVTQQQNLRPIDIEPYQVDNDSPLQFAAIFVDNTGSNHKNWSWGYGASSFSTVQAAWQSFNGRLVDIEKYRQFFRIGGLRELFAYVMVENTGFDRMQWWWGLDYSEAGLENYLALSGQRIWDLEQQPDGRYAFLAVDDDLPVTTHFELTPVGLDLVRALDRARVMDIEQLANGRLAVALMRNDGFLDSFGTSCGAVVHEVVPFLGASPRPGIWHDFDLLAPNVASRPASLVLGLARQHLDLTPFGAPGCAFHQTLDVVAPVAVANGLASVTITVPNDPSLIGQSTFSQFAMVDAFANALGLITSNSVATVFGPN